MAWARVRNWSDLPMEFLRLNKQGFANVALLKANYSVGTVPIKVLKTHKLYRWFESIVTLNSLGPPMREVT